MWGTRSELKIWATSQSVCISIDSWDGGSEVRTGKAGGKWNVNSWTRAVGHCGTYDYQRSIVSPGEFIYIQAYTPVSNINVGAYMEGAGWSRDWTHLIANVVYAHLKKTKNRGPITGSFEPSYNTYLGWDLANEGVNPTCH